MNLMKKPQHLYWPLQLIGWGTFASLTLVFKYFFTQNVSHSDFFLAIVVMALGICLSHLIRWIYTKFNWHSQNLLFILHKVVILAIFTGTINFFVLYSIVSVCPKTVIDTFDLRGILPHIVRLSMAYFIWQILYFIVYFFKNFKEAEIINLQQKSEMNEIHLNKLKSQLNPHFMFNAMNVIRALIDEDKNKAKEGITQLSNILRQTLNVDQKKLITLGEEIRIVQDYLSLEVLRFEERLKFQIDIPSACFDVKIPPMLLQTIVENAIKHGISNSIKGGLIAIKVEETEQELKLVIENPGQYTPVNKEVGFGLNNSKKRLDFIFQGKGGLFIHNLNENTVQTTIQLPKKMDV